MPFAARDDDRGPMSIRGNFFAHVMIAVGIGILAGLFFGESIQPLDVVANVYVRLLQMAVLPYVVVAVIYSIGCLDLAWAKKIGVAP